MRPLLITLILTLCLLPLHAQQTFEALFYEADRQSQKQDYAAAFDLYLQCEALNPESAVVKHKLAQYYMFMRNDSMACRCYEEAVRLNPTNYWYHESLANYYFSKRRTSDAQRVIEGMAERWPDKGDILLMLNEIYSQQNDYANVIKTLDKIEVKEGKSEQLSMAKFRCYVQMKDEASAFKEMKSLADEYPNDLRYHVLIGDLYLDNDKTDQALDVFKEVERKDSTNINVLLSLSSYYEKVGNDSLKQIYVDRVVTSPKLDSQNRQRLVGTLIYDNLQNNKDSVSMLRVIDRVLAMPQEDTQMLELCARYMVSKELSPERVKPLMWRILEIDPESDMARQQLLSYAIQKEDTFGIIDICKPACDMQLTKDPVLYYYYGIASFQAGEHEQALRAMQNGLTFTDSKSNLTLITNMYEMIGDLYHKLGDDQKAYQAFDSCLIYRPDDALVLNNYAYYLSLNKRDLKRAEDMSRRSLEIEPDNINYVDTYAWILYQTKRYAEAKTYIDRVIEMLGDTLQPDDANEFDHAGDIYYRCGFKEEAIDLWVKAMQLGGGDNAAILERKIKRKKL